MMAMKTGGNYWVKAVIAIAVTLIAMPVTHIIARALKEGCQGIEQFYAGMAMGAVGAVMVIAGVFVKGDAKQTLLGLFGGMFYWMGAIDFMFMYYANRFGTQAQLDPVTGEIVSRPEYLLLPATFGFWAMTMILYLFCTVNGCNFLNWWQRLFFGKRKKEIAARPMTRHTSIVTFMEVITMLWTCYLVLMFCYDMRFFGDESVMTLIVGMIGFIGSLYMFARLLRYGAWGISLRYGFATVIIFWISVEVFDRTHLLNRIFADPATELTHIGVIVACLVCGAMFPYFNKSLGKYRERRKSNEEAGVA